MSVVLAGLTTGLPHPLLTPDANPGYRRLRDAFAEARDVIRASGAERLVLYSTYWPSVIGHQAITDPNPRWTHVDELFHDLGSISYDRPVDAALAEAVVDAAKRRGLSARGVNYHGFPMDTGSVTALELLDPDCEWPAVVLSSNVYADRAETLVWAKATRDAIAASSRPTAVFAISSLSNRLFTTFIRPEDDAIHSPKDDEWNRKILQFLSEGRLEDTAQLSRTIQQQIRVKKVVNFKALWWLSAVAGPHNRYHGTVHAYAPVQGTGAAVVTLRPREEGLGDKEFDEDDVEVWRGDREVLS